MHVHADAVFFQVARRGFDALDNIIDVLIDGTEQHRTDGHRCTAQALGGGVGGISELLGGLQDFLFGFWADTRFAAERAVDGTGRNAGRLGNIIDRYSFFFHDALRFYYCIKFFQ